MVNELSLGLTRPAISEVINGSEWTQGVKDSMKTSLTPDDDVTEKKKMKRELAKARVQQQNKEILREISLNRKNPISDNV